MSPATLVVVNVSVWPVIHMAVSFVGVRCPEAWFLPARAAFRPRSWERGGRFYERWLAVRAWKPLLPDGAALLRGAFPKKRLAAREPAYLARFARETCRGEAVHWVTLAFAPVSFAWNPAWAGWVMVGYAVLANVPCIIVQRYNRARLLRSLDYADRPGGAPG
jgi:glycosyl-4,4'-diaponeurosporenoate acyltransferase